jgi:hypothetical protein
VDRRALRILVVALVALTVITLSAATLESTTRSDSNFGIGGSGGGLGEEQTERPTAMGGGGDSGFVDSDSRLGGSFDFQLPCFRFLTDPLVIALLLGGLFGIGALVTRLRNLGEGVAILILISMLGLPIYLFLTACVVRNVEWDLPFVGGRGGGGGSSGFSFSSQSDSAVSPSAPEVLFLIVLVLVIVLAIAIWLSGDRELPSASTGSAPDEDDAVPEPDVAAMGRAAGRAADRLETTDDFENEVFRAWAEMTRPIDVERPDASTPAEFATAATEAGMDSADVDRLTTLFEEVRYGGRMATPERERDAVETLRRIEAQYADADEPNGGNADANG